MNFINKIKEKISNKIKDFSLKHMDEEEAEKIIQEDDRKQKEKLDKEQFQEENKLLVPYSKEELKDLETLLRKVGAIGEEALWIGGFLQLRTNQNAKAANLFTGKKNLRFLTFKDDLFYMLAFKDDKIYSYLTFTKEDVMKVENKKTFSLTLKSGSKMNLDVSENKSKANLLLAKLK